MGSTFVSLRRLFHAGVQNTNLLSLAPVLVAVVLVIAMYCLLCVHRWIQDSISCFKRAQAE